MAIRNGNPWQTIHSNPGLGWDSLLKMECQPGFVTGILGGGVVPMYSFCPQRPSLRSSNLASSLARLRERLLMMPSLVERWAWLKPGSFLHSMGVITTHLKQSLVVYGCFMLWWKNITVGL